MEAVSQNRDPSLEHDRMAINDTLLSRFIPAGFYYKTFMWPRKAWDGLYEPRIRAVAGLGIAPAMADTDSYTQRYAHSVVLVIGAGPSGSIAASEDAATGARVILLDDHAAMGGSVLTGLGAKIDGREWVGKAV